ncbi:MAG: AbrB/MazE/SpoVT family DNA-binding domain-containing protein [Gemmatimonadetes bacterium]|nr:AbrB/MazE/SpoVT family DNA-binding domain-containing protein [Gemmatimonadota bacterium]
MPKVKLSSKSQIVVPAEVRRALGLEPGDVLDVEVLGDRMVATRSDSSDPLERLRSFAGDPVWKGYSAELERSREEWARYSEEIEAEIDRVAGRDPG